jgi:hypothetical protein
MGFNLFEADRFLKELYLEMVNEILNKEKETEEDDETKADCSNK